MTDPTICVRGSEAESGSLPEDMAPIRAYSMKNNPADLESTGLFMLNLKRETRFELAALALASC